MGEARHKAQGTRHKAQGTRHKAQGTRHKAQGTRHKAQGTRHKAQGTRHKAQGTYLQNKSNEKGAEAEGKTQKKTQQMNDESLHGEHQGVRPGAKNIFFR